MFKSNKQNFLRDVRNKFYGNLRDTLAEYENDLKTALDVPPSRSGQVYYHVKGKPVHTAAAPAPGGSLRDVAFPTPGQWEPPAPLSYDLLRSIDKTVWNVTNTHWTGFVYSNSPYVKALELGRKDPPMPMRPVWYHTFVSNWDKYADIALEGFSRR